MLMKIIFVNIDFAAAFEEKALINHEKADVSVFLHVRI